MGYSMVLNGILFFDFVLFKSTTKMILNGIEWFLMVLNGIQLGDF